MNEKVKFVLFVFKHNRQLCSLGRPVFHDRLQYGPGPGEGRPLELHHQWGPNGGHPGGEK